MKNQNSSRSILRAVTLMLVLFSLIAGGGFVSFVSGNPYTNAQYGGERGPSAGVSPPSISFLSPRNDKIYNTCDILLSLNVSTKGFQALESIQQVYFVADWLQNKTIIYYRPRISEWKNTPKICIMDTWYEKFDDLPTIDFENLKLNLTNIPDGKHTITVYATGSGSEYTIFEWYDFYVTGYSKVNFVIDATSPVVSFLSEPNKTYTDSRVPLNFTVNEPVSRITYVLDGQNTSAIYGNTTILDLSNGLHNVTVYATDYVGNRGSETITFIVAKPEPFPITPVAVASGASVAMAGVGLLVYFKKRKGNRNS